MVVHDATGARVACSRIRSEVGIVALDVAEFKKYPGYEGELAVSGSVSIQQVGEKAQVLMYTLIGADGECSTTNRPTEANGCGIHIHQGTDCSNADDIRGHHWDKDKFPEARWKYIEYVGDETIGTTHAVKTGLPVKDIQSRTLVVHDFKGARIACAQIAPNVLPLKAGAFNLYPKYQGELTVQGIVQIGQLGSSTQVLDVSLTGADPGCDGTPNGTNACGVHIHSGTR